MRYDDFQGARHLRVDDFIMKQYHVLQARARVFIDSLHQAQNNAKYNKREKSTDGMMELSCLQEEWQRSNKVLMSPDRSHGQHETPDKKSKPATKAKSSRVGQFVRYLSSKARELTKSEIPQVSINAGHDQNDTTVKKENKTFNLSNRTSSRKRKCTYKCKCNHSPNKK